MTFLVDGLQYSNWSEAIFRQLRAGGVDAVHVTITYHETFRETVANITRWNRWFEAFPGLIFQGFTADDIALAHREGGRTPAYVRAFADWLAERLAARDIDALLDYRRLAPDAARAHPEEEHLLPLFVALGAGGDTAQATRFHAGIDDYVLAMDAWRFD